MSFDVLAIFHLGGVGGAARSVEQVMANLADGGSAAMLFPEEGGALAPYREIGEVAIAPYAAFTYSRRLRDTVPLMAQFRRDVRTFRRELRRRHPDLVIVVTTVLPAALVAARLERVPAIAYAAELHHRGWRAPPLLRFWSEVLALGTARLAGGIVCCSQKVAEQFPSRDGVPVRVAYPPIGPGYAHGDRARGRARHGLQDADPCVAVVGNISRGRGQDTAIRALRMIRAAAPRARLLIDGLPHPRPADVEYAAELRALARELGLADAVVFSEGGDVADIYAAADVVVNPARMDESFGRILPEALIAGRPVVATRVGAVDEVIRDGVDGLVVRHNRPAQLAEAVLRLWRDPDRAARLVAAGRERVMRCFGSEQNLATWRSVVEAVAR